MHLPVYIYFSDFSLSAFTDYRPKFLCTYQKFFSSRIVRLSLAEMWPEFYQHGRLSQPC